MCFMHSGCNQYDVVLVNALYDMTSRGPRSLNQPLFGIVEM